MIQSPLGGYLFSAHSAIVTGSGFDLRAAADRGYLFYVASGESAIFNLEVSHDATAWMIHTRATATATQTGTAQITGVFPYLRGNLTQVYSGSNKTGVVWAHWTPAN